MPDAPSLLDDIPADAAFLPINCVVRETNNLRRRVDRPWLALVDTSRLKEFEPLRWRTLVGRKSSCHGYVFRIASARKPDGTYARVMEGLGARVLGIHTRPDGRIFYRNGDRLDLRAANIRPIAELGTCGFETPPVVAPGSTFMHWSAYADARARRFEDAKQLADKFRAGPTPKLTPDQVFELLEAFANTDMLDGLSYKEIIEQMASPEWLGVTISVPTLRSILRGDQQRISGFDYDKLAAKLPDRGSSRLSNLSLVYQMNLPPEEKFSIKL